MIKSKKFPGFPRECVAFYAQLQANNSKDWFEENRRYYDDFVLAPAKAFVVSLGSELKKIRPEINAIPQIDKSIFRIHRDVRFSKNKEPFKTHLGIWLWEGDTPKMESSGFYFHLEPATIMFGVGVYMFTPRLMPEYRNSVIHPVHGPALQTAMQPIRSQGTYTLGGQHYKRVPRGFETDHPNAELLKHNGFHLGLEMPIPDELYTSEIVDICLHHFNALLPVHIWLNGMIQRAMG